MTTTEIPDFARPFVDRFVGKRREGKAKVVKAPEGITLVRISWMQVEMVGGSRGGYSEDREQVKWATWVGEKFAGSDSRKGAAIDYAVFIRDLDAG